MLDTTAIKDRRGTTITLSRTPKRSTTWWWEGRGPEGDPLRFAVSGEDRARAERRLGFRLGEEDVARALAAAGSQAVSGATVRVGDLALVAAALARDHRGGKSFD